MPRKLRYKDIFRSSFGQSRQHLLADQGKPLSKTAQLMLALLPTFIIIGLTEVVLRYTASGYSVIIIVLLGTTLYTSLRFGFFAGLLSAIIIALYNFYIVAESSGTALMSYETLESGAVIAIVFPVLAVIVGRLKEHNDNLLFREQRARIQAEESAKQLQFMAESMPQKIFTILPNGDADYANRQWQQYLPQSSTKISDWIDTVHPSDYEENVQLWQRSLETGEPFQIEHRLKRNDGKYIWHLTRAHALRDSSGKVELWIGSSTDIEDVRRTKKLEADTARLIKQRSQLMDLTIAKDEFISLASHQLRTPATGVKQYINMVIDGFVGPVPPKVREFLIKANDSNERQLAIINDLLQVAQVDAGKVILRKEQVNVTELLASVIHEQASKFEKRNQKVKFEDRKKQITVMADSAKLRMVLENIIDNASKYSPESSTIKIRAMSSRGKVRISIIDQGVGIEKKDIDKVFQKFMRVDNPLSKAVGGSGLGLYWVKKIIDLHGGDIAVTSVLGEGSTFTISLPT